MTTHPLLAADRRYRTLRRARVRQNQVSDRKIGELADALFGFINTAGPVADGDDWRPVIRKLKRYFFNLRAVPVPSSHPDILPVDMLDMLRDQVDLCDTVYPALEDQSDRLLAKAEVLASSAHAPLLDSVRTHLETTSESNTALLLKEKRHTPLAREMLSDREGNDWIEIITHRALGNETHFREILVIGRPLWFPDFIFQTPHAESTCAFTFAWSRDHLPLEPCFSPELGKSGRTPELVSASQREEQPSSEKASFDVDELEPVTDWDSILRSGLADGRRSSAHTERSARLYRLEDNHAVFLPADPESKVQTLDIEDAEGPNVRRVQVGDIEPGDFLLLRTEGGGNMIEVVANYLLGDDVEQVHRHQREWKKLLRKEVQRKDAEHVAIELLERGSERAKEVNVRNWMSDRNIKPGSREDFAAILKLVGLGKVVERYWESMQKIDRAHRKAGHRLKNLLLEEVRNTDVDVDELYQTGKMSFELSEAGGGKVVAFRILEIAPETFEVPPHRLSTPFPWEE